jgi:hypothetical protein
MHRKTTYIHNTIKYITTGIFIHEFQVKFASDCNQCKRLNASLKQKVDIFQKLFIN